MTKEEYRHQARELSCLIGRLQRQRSDLRKQYMQELLEKNGYKIGQTMFCDGVQCAITGVDNLVDDFYLQLKKVKKDGTVSKQTPSGTYLRYKLTEL